MTTGTGLNQQADALLAASRVLVAISAESLADVEDVLDVTHFRVLVVIASHDGMSLGEVADAAGIHVSRASRICDRLAADSLISRRTAQDDRRQIVLRLTAAGAELVGRVMQHRRQALLRVLQRIPPDDRSAIADAMARFAEAAGERAAPTLWSMGWTT